MNQNLLIVDDEYEILTWLEEMFTYEFDLEIGVYTAESALKALELLDQIKFDVVLTDIKMPGMDGITLFRRIKDNWPRCKTVFLTGYRNFDDMYQIVNHKDAKYILKSEDDEVIQQAVRDALLEMQRELEKEQVDKVQEELLNKTKFWMCREFMDGLLTGKLRELNKEEIVKRRVESTFPIAMENDFLLFLLRVDRGSRDVDSIAALEALELIIRENIPENIVAYLYTIESQQAILLLQPKDQEARAWERIFTVTQGALEYVQDIFQGSYGMSFSVVATSTPINYREVSKIFIRLKQIMVGYLGKEKNVIVHEEALISGKELETPLRAINRLSYLKSHLEMQRRQEFFAVLSECAEELMEAGSKHDAHATELYYSISVLLLQFINENRLYEKIAFRIGLYKLTKMDEHESWMEAAQYLMDVSEAVFQLLGDIEQSLSDRALHRVCEYIDENINGDLSLTRLASVGGFNASYLSRLFKQVYGVTASEYIYQKRMSLAMKLLAESNIKVQDIAARTGYLSPHSFARAFRSCTGTSPAEYRELHRK